MARWRAMAYFHSLTIAQINGQQCFDGGRRHSALINIALNGGGIAQVISHHVAADIADGKLVTAFDEYAPLAQPIHTVYPGGKLLPAKVRAILDDWVPKLRMVLSQM